MRIALSDLARNQRGRLQQLLAASDELVDFDAVPGGSNDVDVLIASRLGPEEAARVRVRLLQVPGAGTDKIALDAVSPDTWICNAYEHEAPIAEYVLAAMLEATVNLPALARQIPDKGWAGAYFSRRPHGELLGRTVGLVGLGHIGAAVAARAKAFGMRVMAVVSRPRAGAPDVDWIGTADRLGEMLAAADFVVLACPLTEATHGMIGAKELAAMKPEALLINVARAEVADEAALYEALQAGGIGGAVLDPWYAYPSGPEDASAQPSRYPFGELPNVKMTAHSAGWTDGVWARRCRLFAENIRRLGAGEALLNVVQAPR
ncbi:MAG: phosphoglycerate dehydrogenase [Rhizobiales bacterium]|nr:phosphoglycerate dehydrogenase [Hyphomicrobiales bacterium]MBN9009144.1 phosphoglycerate dehydrogenase [Hyphomicrobiales bacterium]